jgi:hypothetical protein
MKRTRAVPLRVGLAVAAAVWAAGCGPALELHAGISAEATNVLLGTPLTPPEVASSNGPPVIPAYAGVPALPAPTLPGQPPLVFPVTPPSACPDPSPFAAPPTAVTTTITNAAPAAAFAYRTKGTAKVDGKVTSALSGNAVWETADESPSVPAESRQFSVSHKSFDGSTVTNTYSVVPPATDQNASVPQTPFTPSETVSAQGGLYLSKVETKSGNTTSTFAPAAPGVELLQLPAFASSTWQSQATDPSSMISETVTGKNLGNVRVNACGTKLDAWQAQLSATIMGLNESLTETDTLSIATEYGGLILSIEQIVQGTTQGHEIEQTYTATINSLRPVRKAAG